jgi:hypothetical protein
VGLGAGPGVLRKRITSPGGTQMLSFPVKETRAICVQIMHSDFKPH